MVTRSEEQQQHQQEQEARWFLPTHLSLLRTLHIDDEATGVNAVDSCARPTWVEVSTFIQEQAIIVKRKSRSDRAAAVLRALGGRPIPTPGSPRRSRPDEPFAAQQSESTRADQAGGVGLTGTSSMCGASSEHFQKQKRLCSPSRGQNLNNFRHHQRSRIQLDARSVVCAVLRRAVKEHESEHKVKSVGFRRLKRRVDGTVKHLASSLDGVGLKNESAKTVPWRVTEIEAFRVADTVERHTNKLILWRKLQSALSECGVAEEKDEREELS